MTKTILPTDVLNSLNARNLFYPASGRDIDVPINILYPWIKTFWFVDAYYEKKPFLKLRKQFELIDKKSESLSGATIKSHEKYHVEVYTESFIDTKHNITFHVNKCRGRGYDTFRSILKNNKDQLSIFFYRGDGEGEGGSSFKWLHKDRLKNIFEVLEDGGLIITDGSNGTSKFRLKDKETVEDAVHNKKRFKVWDRELICVGYIGERYGPTLIWRAIKV